MCCHRMSRREFMETTTVLAAGIGLAESPLTLAQTSPEWKDDLWDPQRPYRILSKPLRVQPVLMYSLPTRREAASWKSWGGVQTEEAVNEEVDRITNELTSLTKRAGFPMEVQPVIKAGSDEAMPQVKASDADVTVLYPATGPGSRLRACLADRDGIVFLRHRSGPVYYWYEAMSVKYFRTDTNPQDNPNSGDKPISVHDIVVDDQDELLWRLRALHGVKNFIGARVVALGGAQGKYAPDAPQVARDKYKLDIVEVSYDNFGPRIRAALSDTGRRALAERWTDKYLKIPHTKCDTKREFVVNGFLLYGLFKDLMREHDASIFTIGECMSTILPLSQTTACLTLGLLNDEGLLAFCESDFVIIPPGILLYYISGKPVFLHNSTFPHNAMVTCAHCTSPRRFDGSRYEPATVVTHYESEYGAAPKVDMPKGQEVSFIDPEYATGRWIGIRGTVEENPNYAICRSQQDVRLHGNWRKLMNEARDSHWVMAYGNHLKEIEYAARRIGVTWDTTEEI